MMNYAKRTVCASSLLLVLAVQLVSALNLPVEKSSKEIYADDDMALANNGTVHIRLVFDTTDPSILTLGLELQDVFFELTGSRPPIVDSRHCHGEWRMIRLEQPNEITRLPFRVDMEKRQPGYSINCSKRIVIRYGPERGREAVNAFLQEAFGVTLSTAKKDMENRQRVRHLYLPSDFGPLPEALATVQRERQEKECSELSARAADRSLGTRDRYLAILKLGQNKALSAVPLLIKLCEEDNEHLVKQYALRALGEIQDQRAIPVLITTLEKRVVGNIADEGEEEAILRRHAILALDNMKVLPESVITLIKSTRSSDNEYPSVKEYATMILNKRKEDE